MSFTSLLNYYQDMDINPVPIDLDSDDSWKIHVDKRRNLYERHLGIPLSYLAGRSVLEFGCNSGENALVLAHHGAKLTLVEPNDQIYPRLRSLFKKFGLEDQIVDLSREGVTSFRSGTEYDLVIAEGFINQLDDRVDAVKNIVDHVAPEGRAIISFDCRYGHFIELTRKLVYWRCCELARIDPLGDQSVEIARALFLDDFNRINASRPFEAWWQDVLMNPFAVWNYLWTYDELVPLAESVGAEVLSTSPRWAMIDNMDWYKNTPETVSRHEAFLREWSSRLLYILTGLPTSAHEADQAAVESVSDLVKSISDYVGGGLLAVDYPAALDHFLAKSSDQNAKLFNQDLKQVFVAVGEAKGHEDLMSAYHGTQCLRSLWGAPYHYVSFRKRSLPEAG